MPAAALDHGLKVFTSCPSPILAQPGMRHTGVVFERAVARCPAG